MRKNQCLLFLFLLVAMSPFALGQADKGAGTDKVLLGALTLENILDLPGWFEAEYMDYKPIRGYLDEIPQYMQDVEIVCVMGTWCDDSRREVPRFIRIMQAANIDPAKLRMFGVNRDKASPNGETINYRITKIPTFVFYRAGVEIGRIVEAPVGPLERDFLNILHPLPAPPPEEAPSQIGMPPNRPLPVPPGMQPDGSVKPVPNPDGKVLTPDAPPPQPETPQKSKGK